MVKKLGATVAVALLLATSACGGGRPSEAELSTAMQKGVKTSDQTVKLTKEQADCAAKVFVKSDVSDEALEAIGRARRDVQGVQEGRGCVREDQGRPGRVRLRGAADSRGI